MNSEIALKNGKILPVNERFYTIQGEGFHVGKPAYFIRLGGCDISCSWCDTKYSWETYDYQFIEINELVEDIKKSLINSVVITGGEPTQFNLEKLSLLLKQQKKKTFLETAGAYPVKGHWDWICLSPKQQKPPLHSSYKLANELKVIIYDKYKDFVWAEKQATLVNQACYLYLQAEWSRFETNKEIIIQYIQKNPKWKLSVQLHKLLGIP